jgi:hypothetical protein
MPGSLVKIDPVDGGQTMAHFKAGQNPVFPGENIARMNREFLVASSGCDRKEYIVY